jgi:aminoglycoside 2'-N-acetyltransferase I
MPLKGEAPLSITVVPGSQMPPEERDAIVRFCTHAYDEDMAPIFATYVEPTYVLGTVGDALVSHALWVPRQLQVGDGPMLHTAYVEAVATAPDWRGRGFAAAIMRRVAEEIRTYDLGALSPFSEAYYATLGWERWCGPLFVRTDGGLEASPDDEEVMILRLPRTPMLDVHAPLSVEWRVVEPW